MNELFKEIQDDIRAERVDQFWRQAGRIMLAVSAAVIVATVAGVAWKNYRQSQAMEQTGQLLHGIERFNVNDYKGAVAAFDALAKDASSPYYGVAMLRRAQAETAAGDKKAAAKTYETLAAHDPAHNPFAQLAALHASAAAEPDKRSPFYYTQAENRGWMLLGQGKKDEALKLFAGLRDDAQAPFSMRERMDVAAQQVKMMDNKMIDDKKE